VTKKKRQQLDPDVGFLVPHRPNGERISLPMPGINGQFVGEFTFLAPAGTYTVSLTVTTDQYHGKMLPGNVGHAMSMGGFGSAGGFMDLGGGRWVPDWKGGHLQIVDANDKVLLSVDEAKHERVSTDAPIGRPGAGGHPTIQLAEPQQIWVLPSVELVDSPYYCTFKP
jgi:hypothetical protein